MAVVHRLHRRRQPYGARCDTQTPTAPVAANAATYAANSGVTLMVRASYTDGEGAMKMADGEAAVVVAVDTRNRPPAFEDQDTETKGIQNETTTREVEENTKALRRPTMSSTDDATTRQRLTTQLTMWAVWSMAEDPDPNTDPLIYTLSGD